MCCLLFPVWELNKKPGQECVHCVLKEGCSIYDSRPQSCRDCTCDWLINEEVPEELRPDKCNVTFEKSTEESYLLLNHFDDLNAWKRKPVMDYIKVLNDKGISVIISSYTDEPKKVLCSKGKTPDEIMKNAIKELNK